MNNSQTIIAQFTDQIPQHLQEVAVKLINLLTSKFPNLDYDIKWNQLTFSIDKDFHHWLFAIKATKRSVNVVFHFGGLLDDPDSDLIKGDSFFFRKIEYNANDVIYPEKLAFFINQAISKLDYFKTNWKVLNKK